MGQSRKHKEKAQDKKLDRELFRVLAEIRRTAGQITRNLQILSMQTMPKGAKQYDKR